MISITINLEKTVACCVLVVGCLAPSTIQAAAAGGEIDLDDADRVARFIVSKGYQMSADLDKQENAVNIAHLLRSVDETSSARKKSMLELAKTTAMWNDRGLELIFCDKATAATRALIRSILKLGVNPNMIFPSECPLLSNALAKGDAVLAKILLEAKADIYYARDSSGKTSLDYAIEKNHVFSSRTKKRKQAFEMAQVLIDAGADGSKYLDLLKQGDMPLYARSGLFWEILLKMNLNYNRVPEKLIQENQELMQVINELKERDRKALIAEIGGCLNEPWLIGKGKTSILAGYLGMAES